MAIVKALVLLQLSVLLLSFFTVFGDTEVDSLRFAPSYSPTQPPKHGGHHGGGHHKKTPPPSHAPVYPPAHPPSPPPSHPSPVRQLVAVQGVVYCKSCKYVGVDTLQGGTPLAGAVVKLVCNNTKYPTNPTTKTDKNGYFFILLKDKITSYGAHKCRAYLVSSPVATCNKPTNLHYGLKGATLIPTKPIKPSLPLKPLPQPKPLVLPYQLYSVGPFAFEPTKKCY